jgi:DHA2 family multidrug resistance protein
MSAIALTPGAIVGDAADRPAINPWFIALTVTLATFMELLDTSIANVALPNIAGGLASGVDEATWVLTSYLVANAVVLPLSAWLSEVIGRKRYYLICVALFTGSSLLCGLAPSLGTLIFFRILQGIGGGGLAPVSQAILVDTFSVDKRASAFAVYGQAAVLGPALGPTLGGWITDSMSWRWVFFINIPVGLIALFLASQLVHDPPVMQERTVKARRAGARVDFMGILLIALGFGCLEVVLDKGQRDDWFESSIICGFFAVAVMSLVVAVWWERRQRDPVVDLSLLTERNFVLANVFYFLFGFVLIGATVLQPEMLQSLFGYTPTLAGLSLSPGALLLAFLIPITAKFIPWAGTKKLIFVGFALLALSMWYYSTLDLDATFWQAVGPRLVLGVGLSFLFVPISSLAYSQLPKEKNNKASSLTNLFRNLGGSFGISFVTTMLARRGQFHQNVLVEHINNSDPIALDHFHHLVRTLESAGLSAQAATVKAQAITGQLLDHQVSILSFLDCFWLLGLVALIGVPLALLVKSTKPAAR